MLKTLDVRTVQRFVKLGVSSIVFLVDMVRNGKMADQSRGVILLYHDVHERERTRFRRQLRRLRRYATPVRLDDIEGPPDGRWRAAVTFDDGRRTFLDTALGELEAEQIPVTLFVPSALVGDSIPDEDDSTLMTEEELRALPALVEIGSHGRTHARQSKLDTAQLESELAASRHELEAMLGRPVDRHAYPYGDYSAEVIEMAGDVYRSCYTVVPYLAPLESSLMAGRVVVDPGDWPIEFALKIRGAYRWMGIYMCAKERRAWERRQRGHTPGLHRQTRQLNRAA